METSTQNKSKLYMAKYILFVLLFSALLAIMIFFSSKILSKANQASFTDTNKENNLYPTIILDAGHGGEDGGATGTNGIKEKELNIQVAFDLADMLRANGFDVILTREDDRLLYDINEDYKGRKKQLDLSKRLKIGESIDNAIFVSIHMNSFPQPQYSGLQVYFAPKNPASEKLAKSIQSSVEEHLQKENNRQIKKAGSNIFILNRITKPSVLIECAFLSNPEDCRLICTEEYRKKLSIAIFNGISDFICENNY